MSEKEGERKRGERETETETGVSKMSVPYRGKLSREKTFTNFADLIKFVKLFSMKMGVAHFA